MNTYCGGTYRCNSTMRCELKPYSVDPCDAIHRMVNRFTGMPENREYSMSVICAEPIKACIELYYCMVDADCDDSLYCNGIERCVAGQCSPSITSSMCPGCDEYLQCGNSVKTSATVEEDETSPSTIYVIAGVLAVVGLVAICIVLCNIYKVWK